MSIGGSSFAASPELLTGRIEFSIHSADTAPCVATAGPELDVGDNCWGPERLNGPNLLRDFSHKSAVIMNESISCNTVQACVISLVAGHSVASGMIYWSDDYLSLLEFMSTFIAMGIGTLLLLSLQPKLVTSWLTTAVWFALFVTFWILQLGKELGWPGLGLLPASLLGVSGTGSAATVLSTLSSANVGLLFCMLFCQSGTAVIFIILLVVENDDKAFRMNLYFAASFLGVWLMFLFVFPLSSRSLAQVLDDRDDSFETWASASGASRASASPIMELQEFKVVEEELPPVLSPGQLKPTRCLWLATRNVTNSVQSKRKLRDVLAGYMKGFAPGCNAFAYNFVTSACAPFSVPYSPRVEGKARLWLVESTATTLVASLICVLQPHRFIGGCSTSTVISVLGLVYLPLLLLPIKLAEIQPRWYSWAFTAIPLFALLKTFVIAAILYEFAVGHRSLQKTRAACFVVIGALLGTMFGVLVAYFVYVLYLA